MKLLVAFVSALAATAAFGQAGPPPAGGNGDAHWQPHALYISPMGEPFRGPPPGKALVDAWFNGADTNHDGKLTRGEFRADALRFFAVVDTNHDGIIDTDEVRNYETVIAPEVAGGSFGGGGHRAGGMGGGGGRHGGGRGGGGMGGGMGGGGHRGGGDEPSSGSSSGPAYDSQRIGAARFSTLNIPEPIASADGDFDRSVTRAEFEAAADRRFGMLDPGETGVIARGDLPDYAMPHGGHKGKHRRG